MEAESIAGEEGEVFGVAAVVPPSGVPGTDVAYEVRLDASVGSQVDRVEFFIDSTGEGPLEMEEVSDTFFRNSAMRRPYFDSYPTISTFTFFAYDVSGNEVARGSATDTVMEP